jgi:hypothetical protein
MSRGLTVDDVPGHPQERVSGPRTHLGSEAEAAVGKSRGHERFLPYPGDSQSYDGREAASR